MKYLIRVVAALIISCIAASLCGAKEAEFIPLSKRDLGKITAYEVNKLVKDLPEKEDLSTPESTYAVCNRIIASGDPGSIRRVTSKLTVGKMPPADTPREKVPAEQAQRWLKTKVLEVRIWRDCAQVFAEGVFGPGDSSIDIRTMRLEDGKWLSWGNGFSEDIAEARKGFEQLCRKQLFDRELRPRREKVADPAAYLKPYVDYLKENAKEPREFVMDALKTHEIVILGELHARQIQWQFAQSIVAHPEFAANVGVIYLEMAMDHQALVDKYLASPKCDPEPIIDTFRDEWEQGWPMQSWLDFFTTVWTVNQSLPQEKRIRIVFVDRRRPWKDIRKKSDWDAYERESDRDPLMAQNILEDRKEHEGEKRNGLFIVGYAHASLDFEDASGPVKRAAWLLKEALGSEVYSIIPHAPLVKADNDISGRRCLGLFDSAFMELGSRPMAFPLADSPFGEQIFDGDAYIQTFSRYCDGYSAYLYYGPLEYEISSSMIPGFYTSGFIQEMDRRMKLMKGKGWSELCGKELTVDNVIRQYSYWGKPQGWISKLGPIDAWKYGDDWAAAVKKERLEYAKVHPEVIVQAAKALFDAMRGMDYSQPFDGDWQNWLPRSCRYTVNSNFPGWIDWMYKTFKDNPIDSVELGDSASYSQWGTPIVDYKVKLKDGTLLVGKLPMVYDPLMQVWGGSAGLDWHLPK